jgi:hypothetical protein
MLVITGYSSPVARNGSSRLLMQYRPPVGHGDEHLDALIYVLKEALGTSCIVIDQAPTDGHPQCGFSRCDTMSNASSRSTKAGSFQFEAIAGSR